MKINSLKIILSYKLLLLLIFFILHNPYYGLCHHDLHAPNDNNTPRDGMTDDTATNPQYCITSDYGPRDASGSRFHKGIDYRCINWGSSRKGRPIQAVERGTIVRIDRNSTNRLVIFTVQCYGRIDLPREDPNAAVRWGYLHMYDGSNTDDPPIHDDANFSLVEIRDNQDRPFLVSICWADNNRNRVQSAYCVAPGLTIPWSAVGQSDREGVLPILTTDRVNQGDVIGPSGGSGRAGGYPIHMHIDIRDHSLGIPVDYWDRNEEAALLGENPLYFINHPHPDMELHPLYVQKNETMSAIPITPWAPVFHTTNNSSRHQRLDYRVWSRTPQEVNNVMNYNLDFFNLRESPFDFDRLRIFLYSSSSLENINFDDPNSFAQKRYLINGDNEVRAYEYGFNDDGEFIQTEDVPMSNIPTFRAEFCFGGRGKDEVLDGIFEGLVFPGFIDNTPDNVPSNGQRTGFIVRHTQPGVEDYIYNQWRTRVNKSYADNNNNGNVDNAFLNLNSTVNISDDYFVRYPDGLYIIAAYAEDVNRDPHHAHLSLDRNRNETIGTDEWQQAHTVVIDNFRPYLKEVIITQDDNAGNPIKKYHAKWDPHLENNAVEKLKLTKIIPAEDNEESIEWVKAGLVKITLVFSEDIAVQSNADIQLTIPQGFFPYEDSNGKEFFICFNPWLAIYYEMEEIAGIPFYFDTTREDITLIITKEKKEDGTEYEERGFNAIELSTDIPLADPQKRGKAALAVHIRDLATHTNIPFNAQSETYEECNSDWCFDIDWFNRNVTDATFPVLQFILPGYYDTLHHFFIDPGPPIASFTSSFGRDIINMSINPGVQSSIIIEDDLSKVSYVKIDWGDNHIFEKIYDPPVEKVVEYNTYYQTCENKEYTITVHALDGAGNEQENITIDGEEYPEIKFTVLAKTADFPIGFVANKAADTITTFSLDDCGTVASSLAQVPVGEAPTGAVGRGDGRLYVANLDEGTLSVIDSNYNPDNNAFEFENVEASPVDLGIEFTRKSHLIVTPDGSRAYVADNAGTVHTVNLIYWTDFFDPAGPPYQAITPHSNLSHYNDIYAIHITDYAEIAEMAIDPAGRRLYVVVRDGSGMNSQGGWVAVVDIEYVITEHGSWPQDSFHKIVEEIPLTRGEGGGNLNEPSGIAFTPDGDLAYITGDGTTVLLTEIMNWEDGTGGIVVIDPQAISDPALNSEEQGSPLIDYIPSNIPGAMHELSFISMPSVDYSPYMTLGGGAGSTSILAMQMSYDMLASLYDRTVFSYPVDIDGAESIAISYDGRRAYVTFWATNNYGIINLEPSFDPEGLSAERLPQDNDIFTCSEAILHSLDPLVSVPGEYLAPDEITFSRDGQFIIISNRYQEDDRVTIVDTHKVDDILKQLHAEQLPCNPPEGYPYEVDPEKTTLNMDDLKQYPFDNLPTNTQEIYEGLTRYVLGAEGIDDPDGITVIPSFDKDDDLKYGGSSDLVEAKNRFNSLLKLPPCVDSSSLISTNSENLLSPCREEHNNSSQAIGSPFGDGENNYLPDYKEDSNPGRLVDGVLLPTEGIGYRHHYGDDPYNSDNAGTMSLINLLESIGRKWMDTYPEGPRIIYGDLSRPGGGQFMEIGPDGNIEEGSTQRHAAHQNGLDVDVRYMRSDKTERGFDFVLSNNTGNERDNSIEYDHAKSQEYDVALTTTLINLFLEHDEVEAVFVDPLVIELADEAGMPFDNSRLIARGVRDGSEEGSRRDHDDHFSVRITHTNNPPVAEVAASEMAATREETVELDGSASYDPDHHRISYTWTQKEGVAVALDDPHAAKATFLCPSSSEANELVFGLIVYDGELESPEKIVTVRVNGKPTADAGSDQTAEVGQEVILNGSGSDPDGDELTYRWMQISGLPAHIEDFSQQKVMFIAPWEPSLSSSIELTFALVVSDGYSDSEASEVKVTVNPPPNNPPVADAGHDQYVVLGSLELITLNGSGSYDSDYDNLVYQWTQIAGPQVSLSDSTAIMPTFSLIDITAPATLRFSLVINDGKENSDPITVSITLLSARIGGIVINEVVITPQQDWSAGGFVSYPESGGTVDSDDQWIEIYNNSAEPMDLAGWSIRMLDSSPSQHDLGGGTGVEVYSEGSSLANLLPNGFLVVGNPDGVMDSDCLIELVNSQSSVVDSVEIGDDYGEDGEGDGAPDAGENGISTSYADEAIARVIDGLDTDHDIADFQKSYASPGEFNQYDYDDTF